MSFHIVVGLVWNACVLLVTVTGVDYIGHA